MYASSTEEQERNAVKDSSEREEVEFVRMKRRMPCVVSLIEE